MSDLAICRFAYDGVMTSSGRNALHWAACGGHLGIVKVLIESGLDKDSKDGSDWTPLMIAVSAGREDVAKFFILEQNVDLNVVNSTGQCCLHYAASKNRISLAQCLLEAGANPNVRDWGGTSPLHRAIALENLEIAKLLLDHTMMKDKTEVETFVNLADDVGQTAL